MSATNARFSDVEMTGRSVNVSPVTQESARPAQDHVDEPAIVVNGRWLKVASIYDADWRETDGVADHEEIIGRLRRRKDARADLFTFTQKPTETEPRCPYQYVWDSVAGIPNLKFDDWWTNRVSSDMRKDVRRSAKRGVEVRSVPFTDDLVRGIMGIYNETPIRQGRTFRHYNKSFSDVKKENSTYLERSEFLGAFHGEELVGFLKIVYVGPIARMMQIIAKDSYRGGRPMNALIAKAVERADAAGSTVLTYGKFIYSQGADSVTAFKARNGFENILVPQYFIPLTFKGRLAMLLCLHRGLEWWVPRPVHMLLKRARLWLYLRVGVRASAQSDLQTVD